MHVGAEGNEKDAGKEDDEDTTSCKVVWFAENRVL